MKCIRIIEYEADTTMEIERHLEHTLLTLSPVLRPGDELPTKHGQKDDDLRPSPGEPWKPMMVFHGAKDSPKVSIRLMEEHWEGGRT